MESDFKGGRQYYGSLPKIQRLDKLSIYMALCLDRGRRQDLDGKQSFQYDEI